jgi:lipopolysaccharide/colanic/teichoic acid biosynthesis glycosyltransferase
MSTANASAYDADGAMYRSAHASGSSPLPHRHHEAERRLAIVRPAPAASHALPGSLIPFPQGETAFLPADAVAPSPARLFARLGERLFDVLVASAAMILLAPLFAAVAILIKLKSPGSVFFSQVRCGQNGRPFQCYKFRTMVPNAHWVLEQDDELRASYANSWKLVRDPRVTPIGRILRKTSIDELPQLWNVLKGDMSIVGPRPVQPEELVKLYANHSHLVTSVRPGMTGLWQVSGRSSLTYAQRIALDVHYVQRRSFLFDVKILLLTIPAVILAKGAH